jgi:cytochrome c-type biogenesis protein CcmH/NrfF
MLVQIDIAKKIDAELLVASVMTSKWWSRLSFALIGFALLCFFFAQGAFAQVFSSEVKKVAEDFICQCGCNHQLSACGMVNCGSAVPLQNEIQGYLEQGKSRQEIRDIFISKYSKLILSAPTTRGFDLTAWTMPFVVLFLGLVLVYSLIRVWARRKPALAAQGPGAVPPIPDTYQQQIEKELKDLDS